MPRWRASSSSDALLRVVPTARLLIAYDGAGFRGSAINPGVRTVAGVLADAIGRVTRVPVDLTFAGRTDAGVHAWGQVVSLQLPETIPLDDVAHRLNRMCGPEIAIRDATWVADDFDARFNATYREYHYDLVTTPYPHPLRAATAWHIPQPLNVRAMELGCDAFIGAHDFSSFCRAAEGREGQEPPSLIRRVHFARWRGAGRKDATAGPMLENGVLRFEIRANAFCHQMVRSIVGTLVDVGLGRRRAGDMRAMILARNRAAAGQVAPPHGLCMWNVGYTTIEN